MHGPATTIQPEPPDAPTSLALVRRYLDELNERIGIEVCCGDPLEEAAAYRPPAGVFLVARRAGEAVGCGAMRRLDADVAELKRMWVAPAVRGQGVGGRLLEALEETARRAGYVTARLDTRRELTEAIGLYRRGGYREIPAYNDNPDAQAWFEKSLFAAAAGETGRAG